jgi:arylsulfatase A-like enzyme
MIPMAVSTLFRARALLGMALACSILAASEGRAAPRRPNILFFLTDDQPQICLGAMGNTHIQTPNMDRLAGEGVLFTNAFVTTAICCSNRACILTGQHMRRHGIEDFRTPLSAEAFAETYPVLLRKAGYRTGYLGKFAIGNPNINARHLSLPEDRFDFWYGFPQSINFKQVVDGEPRYLTDLMTEKAIQFLRENPRDQPFCLTVALKEPHGPWNYFDPDVPNAYENAALPVSATFTQAAYDALPDFLQNSLGGRGAPKRLANPDEYKRQIRTYYRLISRADLAVGEIMDAIREFELDDNTVVIFTSDHGDMQGAHGLSGKWLMYEESIRVPLIFRDPRLPPQRRGSRADGMALSIDLAPTMLALAGIPAPEAMQGRDLGPLVRGEGIRWRDDWYYQHTYAHPPQHPIPRCEGVRTEQWKYVRYTDFDPPYEQLFDLAADPGEENNLAADPAEHAETLARLRARCDEYRQTLGR